jgi:hypothetical protein
MPLAAKVFNRTKISLFVLKFLKIGRAVAEPPMKFIGEADIFVIVCNRLI